MALRISQMGSPNGNNSGAATRRGAPQRHKPRPHRTNFPGKKTKGKWKARHLQKRQQLAEGKLARRGKRDVPKLASPSFTPSNPGLLSPTPLRSALCAKSDWTPESGNGWAEMVSDEEFPEFDFQSMPVFADSPRRPRSFPASDDLSIAKHLCDELLFSLPDEEVELREMLEVQWGSDAQLFAHSALYMIAAKFGFELPPLPDLESPEDTNDGLNSLFDEKVDATIGLNPAAADFVFTGNFDFREGLDADVEADDDEATIFEGEFDGGDYESPVVSGRKRPQVCKFWLESRCNKGERCRYMHGYFPEMYGDYAMFGGDYAMFGDDSYCLYGESAAHRDLNSMPAPEEDYDPAVTRYTVGEMLSMRASPLTDSSVTLDNVLVELRQFM